VQWGWEFAAIVYRGFHLIIESFCGHANLIIARTTFISGAHRSGSDGALPPKQNGEVASSCIYLY
jgi:hypothetical protein